MVVQSIPYSCGKRLHYAMHTIAAGFIPPPASLPLAGVKFVPHNTTALPSLRTVIHKKLAV
jgi:hypothetical protein